MLYLESFGNPRAFARIARRLARTKPILAMKGGTTRAGSKAASSHTAALAGSEAAINALFHQAGVIRTRRSTSSSTWRLCSPRSRSRAAVGSPCSRTPAASASSPQTPASRRARAADAERGDAGRAGGGVAGGGEHREPGRHARPAQTTRASPPSCRSSSPTRASTPRSSSSSRRSAWTRTRSAQRSARPRPGRARSPCSACSSADAAPPQRCAVSSRWRRSTTPRRQREH